MKELIILDEVFCPNAMIGGETKIEDLPEGQYEITVSVNKILVLCKRNKEDRYVDKS